MQRKLLNNRPVLVALIMYLIKCYGVIIQLHSLLTSVLIGGEWWVIRFTLRRLHSIPAGNPGTTEDHPPFLLVYLHETPENQADLYYMVFNRQHKTYLNHGRGRYGIIFYENLRSILCIDIAFHVFNIYILISQHFKGLTFPHIR
jgi:hypothetical protein